MGSLIQLKRSLYFEGTYVEAIEALNNITLYPGEGLIVSYLDEGIRKYFLSIGVNNDEKTITPIYNTLEEFIEYVQKIIETSLEAKNYLDIDNISTENSNIVFSKSIDGEILVNYVETPGENESITLAKYIYTTIDNATMTQQEFNELIHDSIIWENL